MVTLFWLWLMFSFAMGSSVLGLHVFVPGCRRADTALGQVQPRHGAAVPCWGCPGLLRLKVKGAVAVWLVTHWGHVRAGAAWGSLGSVVPLWEEDSALLVRRGRAIEGKEGTRIGVSLLCVLYCSPGCSVSDCRCCECLQRASWGMKDSGIRLAAVELLCTKYLFRALPSQFCPGNGGEGPLARLGIIPEYSRLLHMYETVLKANKASPGDGAAAVVQVRLLVVPSSCPLLRCAWMCPSDQCQTQWLEGSLADALCNQLEMSRSRYKILACCSGW